MLSMAVIMTLGAHAQFQEGKAYLGASLTGLNLRYNGMMDLV